MKKITSIALALCFAFAAFAQQGIELGLRVIPQNSAIFNQEDFDAGDELNFESTWGIAFGASAAYNFTDNLGAGLQLIYSTQGQKYIDEESNPNITSQTDLTYFKVPILFHLNTSSEARFMFSMNIGPQFGFLMDAERSTVSLSNSDFEALFGIKTKDLYSSMDLGATLGLGFDVNITENLQAGFKLRLETSLADIEEKDATFQDLVTGTAVKIYDDNRSSSANAVGGLQFGINYIIK